MFTSTETKNYVLNSTLRISVTTVFIIALLIVTQSQANEVSMHWDALRNGKVLVEPIESSDGIPGVGAMFVVNATREQIWNTLVDYEHFREIFDGIDKMEVLNENQDGAMVEFWIDAVLTKLNYVIHRQYRKPGYELTWERISGDLKRIEGSWLILDTPNPDQKVLAYRSFVKVGVIIPTRLVRFGAMRRARSMSIKLRNWIEKHE